MLDKLSGRFVVIRTTRVLAVTFVALFTLAAFVPLRGQSQQNSSMIAGGTQDANSVALNSEATQEAATTDVAEQLTLEKLQAGKKLITESQELSDEVKAKIVEVYDKAIAQLKSADEFEARGQQYSQARKDIPGNLTKFKELLTGQAGTATPQVGPETTLTQAEQSLVTARLNLEEAKKNVTTLENEPKRRAERKTKIPEETSTVEKTLDDIKSKIATGATEGQTIEMTQANRALLLAQQRACKSQIAANTEELLFYDTAGDLLTVRRDVAARQLAIAEKTVEFWLQKVNDLRQKEAEAAKQEAIRAKEETKYANPAIQAIAQKSAELAQTQTELVAEVEAVTKYSESINARLAAVKKSFEEVRAKVNTAGKVTDAMGMALLGQREKLPDIRENQKRMRSRPSEISLAQFHGMERDREWSDLSDLTDELDAVLAQLDPSVGEAEREAIKKEATNYYESQRKMLRAIADLYWDYSTKLANLDATERQYVNTVLAYANFIDANILWVKSSLALRLSDLRASLFALGWLFSPANWNQIAISLWTDFKEDTLAYLAALLIVVSLVVLHPKAHRAVEIISKRVRNVQTDSFLHTLKTLGLTLFLASTWPIILFLFQWRLTSSVFDDDFSQALAWGLRALVPVVFMLGFLRHFSMPHGLAQEHLRMRHEPLSFFRRLLGWYFVLAIPVIFLVEIMQTQQTSEQWYNSAGRLFFMFGLLALALFLLILLSLTGTLMKPYLKQRHGGWMERLRYVWYPLCFILPVVFAILAGMGYFYAARQLSEKLVITIILILLAILVRAMFVRWLMVAQRKLALLERQKREAAEQEQQNQGESALVKESQQSKSTDETSIFQISQQTRRLIDMITVFLPIGGIWYVWNDVLPALGELAKIELWRMSGEEIVTLGSLATVLFLVVLTVIITRNVPGLLEIIVLRRLPLDRGVRFAITTLFRYTLAVIGIVLAFGKIGIGWSKVQWLVAAMTVGLGFGLQEIFANFVSGLIILFEQPIRVDDVVTIGEVTGRVDKIRIRATTIRRWDQRELVVPNKEFITGHLINWTLSDNVLRREFLVGIAYGSDTAKAERILYEVARANPMVLEDPKPMVILKTFGNNSLEFELRVYIAGIDNYIPIWHSINCAIDREFRKAGIEIAFPQRDIHIRSVAKSIPIDTKRTQQ
ncbi:MAG: mechanosensitive ion channel [Phycisphaerales bacterium]|jgi:potassium efflux system protein